MKNYPRLGDVLMVSMKRSLLCGLLLTAVPALSFGQGVKVEYAHLDGIGNVIAVSNSAGVEIESHDYLPFGEEWCGTSVCGSVKAGQSRRFTGKERDAETGLDYFGARYFSSKVGRFTTIDPVFTWQENLVDPQRWNRYGYAHNNPLRYVDPDGRTPITAAIGIGVGFVFSYVGSAAVQTYQTGSFNHDAAVISGVGGAVSGGLAGATLGLSVLAGASFGTVAAVSAASNVTGGAVARQLDADPGTSPFQPGSMGLDAAAGVLGAKLGTRLEGTMRAAVPQMERTAAGMAPAARAGNFGAGNGIRGIKAKIGGVQADARAVGTVVGSQLTDAAFPKAAAVASGREKEKK